MEPRPSRPPVPLTCRACSAPLGWLSRDRRRFSLAPAVAAVHDPAAHAVRLRCPCGHCRQLKGGKELVISGIFALID